MATRRELPVGMMQTEQGAGPTISSKAGSTPAIFGINALGVKPGLTGGGETYLRELITHLALVDSRNQYRLFVTSTTRDHFRLNAPNFRPIVVPLPLRGRLSRRALQQFWLPAAARQAGVDVLLCPTGSIPLLYSGPAV